MSTSPDDTTTFLSSVLMDTASVSLPSTKRHKTWPMMSGHGHYNNKKNMWTVINEPPTSSAAWGFTTGTLSWNACSCAAVNVHLKEKYRLEAKLNLYLSNSVPTFSLSGSIEWGSTKVNILNKKRLWWVGNGKPEEESIGTNADR